MKNTYPTHSPQWWFDNYLPEPYRSEALDNYDEDFNGEHQVLSVAAAIQTGFDWQLTPESQKIKYWRELFERACKGEFDKPQP